MKQVRFRPGVREFLRTLEADDRRRIGYAIHVFATTGVGDIRKLTDREGHYRLRVGNWRIRCQLEADAIRILDVSRRDKAYRD